MALEIERKFRVVGDSWRSQTIAAHRIRQAYLAKTDRLSLRVRIRDPDRSTLTIKTAAPGIERHEYEYPIPVTDAEALLEQREGAVILKLRHVVPLGDLTWEIDEFEGDNAGLVVAEVELARADQSFAQPPWIGEEVTHDRRFYNADLAHRPFTRW
jgi:adenylate cyclase